MLNINGLLCTRVESRSGGNGGTGRGFELLPTPACCAARHGRLFNSSSIAARFPEGVEIAALLLVLVGEVVGIRVPLELPLTADWPGRLVRVESHARATASGPESGLSCGID